MIPCLIIGKLLYVASPAGRLFPDYCYVLTCHSKQMCSSGVDWVVYLRPVAAGEIFFWGGTQHNNSFQQISTLFFTVSDVPLTLPRGSF